MISAYNQAAFNIGATLAQNYASDWCAMTCAQRAAHEFDIMHYIDSKPNEAKFFAAMFDVTLTEAQLAIDVAEWLVCCASMFDNVRAIDTADLGANE